MGREYVAAEMSEVLVSLKEVMVLCKKWIRREPDSEDLPAVFRSASLAETVAEMRPQYRRHGGNRPATITMGEFLERRRTLLPADQPNDDLFAETELRRQCSLHVVDLHLCSWDEMVKEETEDYIDHMDMPPWDTWLWCDDHYLVSWVPVWMKHRLDSGICSESHGAHSWLRVSFDNRLEIVGFGESALLG